MYSTGITGQSSGRTKWVTPNVYQSTTSVSVERPVGRGPGGAARRRPRAGWGTRPRRAARRLAYGVTHRLWRANPARLPDARLGRREHRRRRHGGHELVADGLAECRSRLESLTTRQARLVAAFMSRCAASSVVSGVTAGSERVGPRVVGSRRDTTSASTSWTEFAVPSTSRSRRAENRCWWWGAASPGCDHVRRTRGVSPGAIAIGDMMPVSFTSSWMLPSR